MAQTKTAFIRKISEFCREEGLFSPGDRVLCALSGGCDSVAMTLLLKDMERLLGIEISAAHVNHMLRKGEAERDEAFCAELCGRRGIPFFPLRGDAAREAQRQGKGVESGARTLRYGLLEALAAERGFDKIATAHTADDNLETLLLNLARGAGSKGLSAIPPVRGKIVRPVLCLERADTEAAAALYGEGYVTDSTNDCELYMRNIIRREAVPALKRVNPAVSQSALRACADLRRDAAALDRMAKAAAFCRHETSAEELAGLEDAVALRAVRDEAAAFGVEAGRSLCEAVLRIARGGAPSASVDIGNGAVARREYGRLVFERPEAPEFFETPLLLGANAGLPGGRTVTVEKKPGGSGERIYKLFNIAYVNCDIIPCITAKGGERATGLAARARAAGDRFQRNEKSGEKPLSAVYSDMKLPRRKRDAALLIAGGEKIIWAEFLGRNTAIPELDPGRDYYKITVEGEKDNA